MKKILITLVGLFVCTVAIYAENIKFKVAGPEASYNQVRIMNESDYDEFDGKVYRLSEQDGSFVIKETLGVFHIKYQHDTDSVSAKIRRGEWLGVSLAGSDKVVPFRIDYMDLPFFDVVQVYLLSEEEQVVEVKKEEDPYEFDQSDVGQEF